ncbi:MAG: hypothetical protein B6240_11075 [Desulfobacteraceae bacterium 4572_87]|nr:MAG: hypothetical protein B6240_11075 [Desulfobacteraceae bacterium 4572_87]
MKRVFHLKRIEFMWESISQWAQGIKGVWVLAVMLDELNALRYIRFRKNEPRLFSCLQMIMFTDDHFYK